GAPLFEETDIAHMAGVNPSIEKGLADFQASGGADGSLTKVLFAMPGFSLVYAWFKSGYPLPLHSHNADCLYYIISGSIRLGTEDLGKGDGFFVGCDVPCAYTPGP